MSNIAKAPIIIPRIVSIEKLSTVLNCCQEKWPGHPIEVFTSANRKGELELDKRIDKVTVFEMSSKSEENSPLHYNQRSKAVVYPIGNQHGSGYSNVYKAFSHIESEAIYLAPYCKGLSRVTRKQLKSLCKKEHFLASLGSPIALLLTHWILKKLK